MTQDRDYKLKFDKMRENNPASEPPDADSSEKYPSGSSTRNVLFVLTNGDEEFLNYSYLVHTKFKKNEDCIILSFTTHTVTIKGVNLKDLFQELFEHVPKVISCTDERYNALQEEAGTIVNGIEIVTN